MLIDEILNTYQLNKERIKQRLDDFKNLPEEQRFPEFLFCLLTPQSNAQRCWDAVQEIMKLKSSEKSKISEILKIRVRFHNTKASRIKNAKKNWTAVNHLLNNEKNIYELRSLLVEKVDGYGLKEASHFLRNIGKSDNKIAILDRHILRNLKSLNVVKEDRIKNKKEYLEIENRFLRFSKKIKIPVDELDLLFWSRENGEIFK